ncbi:hypothetical protein BDBG_03997 [Blastomyces gilchristii SLH14081]|uniref:Uncharacterized protein n=1 Tax=Blastomyces gilchristii (strain SLH14081) TaxID=559298 RepID=A0A179UNL1_BLAGS|nr:uncharacterized protein BDBG_03997 [Blastomyces gilchristii SLH14081]OAT08002.1 hypothetical protein BDBG_03997 [Blastomyces gilchristii SLH14081]
MSGQRLCEQGEDDCRPAELQETLATLRASQELSARVFVSSSISAPSAGKKQSEESQGHSQEAQQQSDIVYEDIEIEKIFILEKFLNQYADIVRNTLSLLSE